MVQASRLHSRWDGLSARACSRDGRTTRNPDSAETVTHPPTGARLATQGYRRRREPARPAVAHYAWVIHSGDTANGPSALGATEESNNPHARPLAPSGSPSNAKPFIPNGYRPSGLPHLPRRSRRRQPNPTLWMPPDPSRWQSSTPPHSLPTLCPPSPL